MIIIYIFFLFSISSFVNSWTRFNVSNQQCDILQPGCEPININLFMNGDWRGSGTRSLLTEKDCVNKGDFGIVLCERMFVGKDCSLYSPWGTRITSCSDINNDDSIFVVPDKRIFVMPTRGVGTTSEIMHLGQPVGLPIIVETLSEYPRIFKLKNFFSEDEAEGLLGHALSKLEPSDFALRLQSGTQFTAEAATDSISEQSYTLRKRAFDLLGIFPFDDSLSEGLHILHYNSSMMALSLHSDWLSSNGLESRHPSNSNIQIDHDYDSIGEGTNRFATILFYIDEPEEGGETFFPEADPLQEISLKNGKTRQLSPFSAVEYSWERNLQEKCRSGQGLLVQGHRLEALLFYNQLPDGSHDQKSIHAGCPVSKGEKWIASLYVWNGPKAGYWHREALSGKLEKPKTLAVSASFESRDVLFAKLFWEDQIWEELIPGRPIKVNTFAGHKWHVKLDNDLIATWEILPDRPRQRFVVTSTDLPVRFL